MATLYTLDVEDRPGTLGHVAGVLHEAGINIDGFAAGPTMLAIVAGEQDADEAFTSAGIGFASREVIEIELENRPGALARVAKALGEKGVNIEVSLGAGHGDIGGSIYVGVDDVDAAWEALDGLGAA